MANSSILAWRIPWTEDPGGLESLELQESHMTEHTHKHTHTTQGVDVSKEISLLFKWNSYLLFHLTGQRLLTVRSTCQSLE